MFGFRKEHNDENFKSIGITVSNDYGSNLGVG